MNRLMQMLLERRGIYMEEAGEHGAAGGGGAGGDAGDKGGQENGAAGEQGDKGNGDGDGAGDSDDDGGDADGDGDKGESGSKSGVDDEKAKLIKDTMKWKDQARKAQQDLDEIRKQLGDIDPAAARKLADEAKERERTELEKKGEYDRIVAQMKDENAKLLKAKQDELDEVLKIKSDLEKSVEDLTLGVKFRESEFVKTESAIPASFAQKEFRDYFELDGDTLVPYTKPRGAKDRSVMVDADGKPKSFEQAIAALYDAHPDSKNLRRTKVKPGAGSKSQLDVTNKDTKASEVRGLGKIEQGLKDLGKTNQ